MDLKLEVLVLPVSDVDRAKAFYEAVGFRLDADHVTDETYRVVHMTPPGSPCSVLFGTGVTLAAPGSSKGLHLIVSDIFEARDELVGRGVEVGDIYHDTSDIFHRGDAFKRDVGGERVHAQLANAVAGHGGLDEAGSDAVGENVIFRLGPGEATG